MAEPSMEKFDKGQATMGAANPRRAEAPPQARGAGGPGSQSAGRHQVGGLVKVHTLPGK